MTEEKNEGQESQAQNETAQPQQPAAEPKKKGCGCFRKIALTIIIVIVAILLAFEFFGNKGIKMAIETAGTKVLNVDVTLGGISLSPIAGKLELEELVVGNPEGFETDSLLDMSEANVKLSVPSLLGDTVEIEHIKIDGIAFTLEQKGLTSNLSTILDSMPKSESSDDKKEEEKTDSEKSGGKNLHISTLEITNVTVSVKLLPIAGQADTITLPIPDIVKSDIGGSDSEESIDTENLITKIIEWISEAIAEAGTGILPSDLTGSLTSALEQLNIEDLAGSTVEEATQVLEDATGVGGEVLEKTKEVGEGLTEGLQGLFNN